MSLIEKSIKPKSKSNDKKSLTIGEQIGSGTFSNVFKISAPGKSTQWVVKHHNNEDPKQKEVEKYTLVLLKMINHPNVIKVKSVAHPQYDVLEYCCYGDLYDLVARTKQGLSETAARVLLSQTLNSYNVLLKLGFIHTDIKLENVVINREFHAKIIDFGTIFPLDDQFSNCEIGTTAYNSPEKMIGAKNPSKKLTYNNYLNDMYGLGVIFYSMLYRSYLFSESGKQSEYREFKYDALEVVKSKTEVQGRVQKFEHLKGEGARLLAAMMEFDPKKRFRMSFLDRNSPDYVNSFAMYLYVSSSDFEIYKTEIESLFK